MSSNEEDIKGIRILDEVAARALDDPDYHDALLADPRRVLNEAGLSVREDLEVVVVENTPDRVFLVLPSGPPEDELDPEEVALELLILQTKF